MADIRIKDLATTAASTASDDFVAVDGSANGTRKLNAFSPTFGGNLTVSGSSSVIGAATTTGRTLNLNGSLGIANYDYSGDYGLSSTVGALIGSNSTSASLRLAVLATDSTSDPFVNFLTSGASNWAIGIDNSDSDAFVISRNTSPGTNNALRLDATTATLAGNLTVSGTGTSTFGGQVTSSVNAASTANLGNFVASNAALNGFTSYSSSASLDQKYWTFQSGTAVGDGTFRLRALNDAQTNGINALTFTRSGISSIAATIGGNLTVSGGTVTSGSGTLTLNSSANTVVLQSAGTTALTLDSSQNATFAGTNVVLSGTGTREIKAVSTNNGQTSFVLDGGSGNAWSIYKPASSTDIRFYGNGADRLTLTNAGDATFAGKLTTKGSSLSATENVNVSTTAVDLAIATSVGGLYFVSGYNASGGAQGTWLVMVRGTVVTTISSDNNTGLTVTFSMSSGKLQAATASGTLVANTTAITR